MNDWLLHAGEAGLLPTWQGLRLVAADASKLRFGHRASHVPRAASTEQVAFGLVRHVASTGKVRVLMTNLLDTQAFPLALFGDLYHHRWRIEEAFKSLKLRLNLEHVSGLSQLAAMQDFAARILCDNLQALASQAAVSGAALPADRRINRAYAQTVLKPLLPALLLGRLAAQAFQQALALIARQTYHHRPGRSKPRAKQDKPHRHMSQKPC